MEERKKRIADLLNRLYVIKNIEKHEHILARKKADKGKFVILWQLLKIDGLSESGLNYIEGYVNYIEHKIEKINKRSIQESALTRKEKDGISHSTIAASSCSL